MVEVLSKLNEPSFIESLGMAGFRLLDAGKNDLHRVIYSFTLYERGTNANYVRIQADNLDQPLDINEGAKLDLGSTAKLRTLITYLEIITELHGRYAHLPRPQLRSVAADATDNLTRWVSTYLSDAADRSLTALLNAAMERRYSANPGERFFTGGGVHTFGNFDDKDNGSILTVTEALRSSINLVFIRMMRDVAQYYVAEGAEDAGGTLLTDPNNPARQAYLEQFADKEGSHFLNRFYTDYREKSPDEALALLATRVRPVPHRLATAFLSVKPKASLAEFTQFMSDRLPKAELSNQILERLFDKYAKDKWNLADRGYIAGVHPLQLWLVEYLQDHPEAKRSEVLAGQRRRAAGNLCMAVQDQPQAGAGHPHPHPDGSRSLPAHPQVLGAAWLPVRQPDAFLCDRDRQLRRPSRRAGRPDGHHRLRRHPGPDAARRAHALRDRHAL